MGLVFFVCDQKKSCSRYYACGKNNADGCHHTMSKEHAIYREHDWKDFEKDENGNYWEKVRDERR